MPVYQASYLEFVEISYVRHSRRFAQILPKNLPKLVSANFVTNALRDLEVIFQLLICGTDAAITPVDCISGLEIEFYPNLTPEWTL